MEIINCLFTVLFITEYVVNYHGWFPLDVSLLICIYPCYILGYWRYSWLRGQGGDSVVSLCAIRFGSYCLHLLLFSFLLPDTFMYYIKIVSCFYLPFYLDLSERTGARISPWFRQWPLLQNLFKRLFGFTLIKTCDLKKEKQCIFALHPHGLLPIGAVANILTTCSDFDTLFPTLKKRVIVAATSMSLFPIFRDLFLMLGNNNPSGACDAFISKITYACLADCSRSSFVNFLQQGYTVGVFVGGAHEAKYANPYPDIEILDLHRKNGFIRLALMHQVPVVPVYTFNEVDIYTQLSHTTIERIPLLSYALHVVNRVSGIIFVISNLIPTPTHLTTVVGAPIHFDYVAGGREPTPSEIKAAKGVYVRALKTLYNQYSPIYSSNKDRKLVIT